MNDLDLDLQEARILVIDDQSINLKLLEGVLRQGGYPNYQMLSDSRMAAEVVEEYRPDLLILDLNMPHQNGFEVMAQVRSHNLPVLVMTADEHPGVRRRALTAGARDFLTLPIDALETLLRIRNLLETRFLLKRLRQSSDRQMALLDQANDAIILCDKLGTVQFWNRGAQRLYGWSADHVVGRPLTEFLFPKYPETFWNLIETVHQEGTWTGELAQRSRDEVDLTVQARWSGLESAYMLIHSDITERVALERNMLRAQRLESIGLLAGGIAHDLNNCLAPLSLGLDFLRDQVESEDAISLMDVMEASLRRARDLVKQIVTFARGLDSGREPLCVGEVVKEILRLLLQTFPKSIQIEAEIEDDLASVRGNATQLHQVVANLCVNARDAMPNGGRLHLSVRKNEGNVVVTVSDTGMGMPPEVRERIFESFFSTKEIGKGTGLGLATVQSIVKNHGGRIEVDSTPGVGTTFSVYLPGLAATQTAPSPAADSKTAAGKGETILFVDDEPSLRQLAKSALESHGYRVMCANDREQAMALYSKHAQEIDLVMADCNIDEIRDVPVVVCSGADQPANGMQLSKPYGIENLLTCVRQVLDGH